jgi:hypothetical protein
MNILHKQADGHHFPPRFKALSKDDVEKMLVTGAASNDVGIRLNIVNIAGNVGLMHVSKIVAKVQNNQINSKYRRFLGI